MARGHLSLCTVHRTRRLKRAFVNTDGAQSTTVITTQYNSRRKFRFSQIKAEGLTTACAFPSPPLTLFLSGYLELPPSCCLTPASSSTPSSTSWGKEETPRAPQQLWPPLFVLRWALWDRQWPPRSHQPLEPQDRWSANTSPCMHVSRTPSLLPSLKVSTTTSGSCMVGMTAVISDRHSPVTCTPVRGLGALWVA